MTKPYGNTVTHIDGTVHITRMEVRRKDHPESPEGPAWMAISKCGIEFRLDGTVEPSVTQNMIEGMMMGDEATCESCKAAP